MSNIQIDQIGRTIRGQIDTFERDVSVGMSRAVDYAMAAMVTETRKNAQVKSGKYQKSISSKVGEDKLYSYSRVWYVKKPRYRLAHLLDKGHKLRNGRIYDGNQHVAIAADHAADLLQQKLREVIRDAGSKN